MNAQHQKWIEDHIPHRIRAAIAQTPMLQQSVPAWRDPQSDYDTVPGRCLGDAVWEGRLAATRWLIEFIGVKQDNNGNAAEAKKNPQFLNDIRATDFPGGTLFPYNTPEGIFLSSIWRGCSQGGMHATEGSGHPSVNEPELNKALTIILAHLDNTLYAAAGRRALDFALQ